MRPRRDKNIFILVSVFVVSIGASKCPESRKPHVTSCTIFYNCINLPEGGYVWAPAKCAEGLVFQPYLRICVLPGDTWTCDNLSTEKSILNDQYEKPELINPAQTSYLRYPQVTTSPTSRPLIDSSYTIDVSSEFANQRPIVTPYPLIKIDNEKEKNVETNDQKDTNNVAITQTIERKVENYLYRFFNNQQRLQTKFGSLENNDGNNNLPWLGGIIDKMLLYENIAEFDSSTSCELSSQVNLKKSDFDNVVKKNMLNYLVQSYILRRSLMGKLKKSKRQSTTTERNEDNEDQSVSLATTVNDNPVDSLIDGPKFENNVIVIQGNLGGKEYITVSKYKLLSSKVKLQVYEILPCAKGIRLPNRTDCTKYYTCDPETATIVEFSCSSRTAFNDYKRICEIHKYKNCVRELNEQETTTIFSDDEAATLIPDETESSVKDEPCQNTGKYVDSGSEKHYYVCFSSQLNPTKIESLRMICPNDLIFCQERRVCTTKKRCSDN